jgi:hypothetical protein
MRYDAMRERESRDDDIEKRLGKGGEGERGAQSEEVRQAQTYTPWKKTKETL